MTNDDLAGSPTDAQPWVSSLGPRAFSTHRGDIELVGEQWGEPSDPTVLLIAGAGEQMIWWSPRFLLALVAARFSVVRFDHRDTGKSTWVTTGAARRPLGGATTPSDPPGYDLADLAEDARCVIDTVEADAAHVVGVSMGAMVAQELALRHPRRVRSLTSIMGTTGDPAVGQPTAEAIRLLFRGPPRQRDAAIEARIEVRRMMATPGTFDEDEALSFATEEHDRGFNPAGTGRHLAAARSAGDRTAALSRLTVPTLVIHGDADPVIDVSGGQATAATIPNAAYLELEGMAHDLPEAAWPVVLSALLGHLASE